MKQEEEIIKRLEDLAKKSYKQNVYTFSFFLGPADFLLMSDNRDKFSYIDYSDFGGIPDCERRVVRFGSEEMFGYDIKWPIKLIAVYPVIEKFSDKLNHRDFLGALMNLGIERAVLGDILVRDNNKAYIFCHDKMADFIVDNLMQIKHTKVRCEIIEDVEGLDALKPVLVDNDVIVASPRFDAIIAALIKCSRSDAIELFRTGKITLNGRLNEKNSMTLKPGDVFSVRGYGKYRYEMEGKETRKGRIYVHIKKYT